MKRKKTIELIHYILSLLVEKKYKEIYDIDSRKLLSIIEIKESIEETGLILSLPSLKELKEIEIYKTDEKNEVYVDIELWYEGKESDVTLSMSVIDNKKDTYDFSIENIHIL